jgi:hypothetical protein
MNGTKAAATMMVPAALLAASMLLWSAPMLAAPVLSAEAACAIAKARVSAHRRFPVSRIASCETIRATGSPEGYYILALYGRCREEVCGSTNMGWFAIERSTGRVFEWNVAGSRLGLAISL